MIDLNPNHLETVRRILAEHVPACEVRAFGSRVTWTAKDYSDLDLAVVGVAALDRGTLARLKEAFEESDLPMQVDVLDWHGISRSFQEVIERDYAVIQGAGTEPTRVRNGWHNMVLGEVCTKIGSGATPKGGKNTYLPQGPYALIRSQNVYNDGFAHEGLAFINDDQANDLKNVEVMPGDVLLNITGDSVARVCQVEPGVLPARVNQHVAIVRPDPDKLDPRFLRYYLVSPQIQNMLLSWADSGSTRKALTKKIIESFEVSAPADVDEQRAIAHILGTLDDKIELNRRMNETLEEMARALFKSWFVDFDPVRAKMEGRWRRGESLPGMPAELYELFPDGLVDSELGEIPAGWEIKQLGECFNLTMGQSPPGSTYNDNGEGLPFFQGNADFGFRYPEKRRYCTAPNRIARPDDTLVSVRAPVGAINMTWEECCIGRGVAALRHSSGSTSFTYYSVWALQEEIQQYEHTGTVFGAITKRQFESLRVIQPPAELVDCFETQVKSLDQRIRSNVSSSRTLTDQRDTLLPKLISGELRVGREE